jgi:hypothetical protein
MCGLFHNIPTVSLSIVTTANWRFTLIHMLQTVAQYGGREGQYWAPNANYCAVKWLYLGNRSEWDTCTYTSTLFFLLRMTDNMTSHNIDLSFWDTPYTKNTYIRVLSYFSTLSTPELRHFYQGISFCMSMSKKSATCELSHVLTPFINSLLLKRFDLGQFFR